MYVNKIHGNNILMYIVIVRNCFILIVNTETNNNSYNNSIYTSM